MNRTLRIGLEILVFTLAVMLVNLQFPGNPGFLTSAYNPYTLLVLVIAAYYGVYAGFLALFLSVLVIAFPLPEVIAAIHPERTASASREYLLPYARFHIPVMLVTVYVFGFIHNSFRGQIDRYRVLLRKAVRERTRKEREAEILHSVNREFEERVLRQYESISALFAQIKALDTHDLPKTLNLLLQTVERFSRAQKASIWEFNEKTKQLELIANTGWQQEDMISTALSLDDTIEGWVFRNDQLFSIRMLTRISHFQKMESGRNILTFPIHAGKRIWGVLNIEEMPFVKYNLYTEQLLSVTVELAAPALENAVEYAAVIRFADMHPHTGYPSYGQFLPALERELGKGMDQRSAVSLILIEMSNFDQLVEDSDEERVFALFASLLQELQKQTTCLLQPFHYRAQNQIAIICPHLDYDGTSLLCLESLGFISEHPWMLNDRRAAVEVLMGYATQFREPARVTDMLQVAEQLLEMQKV